MKRFAPVRNVLTLCLLSVCAGTALLAQAGGFPVDSGAINVRDYGAAGDGKHDDTESIQRAIMAAGPDTIDSVWQEKIVYFPDGVYLISAPLRRHYATGEFASGMNLIGQSEHGTVLKLRDHAAGYDHADQPHAMIFTSSKLHEKSGPFGGGKDYPMLGEGNEAFNNSVENMTVDVGIGNPGAVGIDYLASNTGAIRHVTINAPSGSGLVGVALTRKYIGPALLDHVTIHGFNVGLDVANLLYGITMNHILVQGAEIGLRNKSNMVAANDLVIDSTGPSVLNLAPEGEIVLAQAELKSVSSDTVRNEAGVIVFHDSVATNTDKYGRGGKLNGYLMAQSWTPIDAKDFKPIIDAPAVPEEPVEKWVSVAKYGAVGIPLTDVAGEAPVKPVDSYKAFAAALASGASTIYIPHGTYYLSQNLVIPATVKRIVGMNSALSPFHENGYHLNREQGIVRVTSKDGHADPIQIEHLSFYNKDGGPQWGLEDDSNRPFLLREAFFTGMTMIHRSESAGPLFLSDTNSGGRNVILGKAPFHAVQLNMERCDICVTTNGADVSILGIKSELDVTLIQATGGTTQIVGGLVFLVRKNENPEKPALHVIDGKMTASFVEVSFLPDTTYKYYMSVTRNGQTAKVEQSRFPKRNDKSEARLVPWLSSESY